MKIRRGKRIHPGGILYTFTGEVGDEVELTSAEIAAGSLIHGQSITVFGCHLDRVRIAEAPGLRMTESTLHISDAATAVLDESSWNDVVISESRWTGARMNHAYVTDVTFENCLMTSVQVQESRLRRVRFEECDLRGSYFNGSIMEGTVFEGSNLAGSDFSGAVISECDFRRANIEDIRVAPEQLSGVIVTADQALYLARLLGLEIRE